MFLFGRNKKSTVENISIDPSAYVNNKPDVLETIEKLGLPRKKLIITGGAALTLLGLPRFANDVDAIVDDDILQSLKNTDKLADGMPVKDVSSHGNTLLKVESTPLPSELLLPPQTFSPITFDELYNRHTIKSPDGITLQMPMDIWSHKHPSVPRIVVGSPQERLRKLAMDRYDSGLLLEYTDGQVHKNVS